MELYSRFLDRKVTGLRPAWSPRFLPTPLCARLLCTPEGGRGGRALGRSGAPGRPPCPRGWLGTARCSPGAAPARPRRLPAAAPRRPGARLRLPALPAGAPAAGRGHLRRRVLRLLLRQPLAVPGLALLAPPQPFPPAGPRGRRGRRGRRRLRGGLGGPGAQQEGGARPGRASAAPAGTVPGQSLVP